jgi:hypothetical protein
LTAITYGGISTADRKAHAKAARRERSWWRLWILDAPEGVVLAVALTAGYIVAGWVFRYHFGYNPGDALARTAKAVYVAVSRDPHVGAIGFYWPPLPMLLEIPFVVILRPFGHMDFAGPISTAVLTGAAIVVLTRICREVGLSRPTTFAVCLLYGLNPVIFIYAFNGMSEATIYLCLLFVILGWMRWVKYQRATDMGLVAIAMAAGVMARLESFPVVIVMGFLIGAGRDPIRWLMRWSMVVAPAVFAVAVWMGVQWLLLGDPTAFLNNGQPHGQNPATIPGGAPAAKSVPLGWTQSFRAAFGLPRIPGYIGALPWAFNWVLVLAPALLVLLVLALVRWRSRLYTVLGLVAGAACFPLFQIYQADHQIGWSDPRYFSEMIPFGTVAAACIAAWIVADVRTRKVTAEPARRSLGARAAPIFALAVAVTLLVGTSASTLAYERVKVHTNIGGEYYVLQILSGRHIVVQSTDVRGCWCSRTLPDGQAIDAMIDPYLAKGAKVIIDTTSMAVLDLQTKYPKQFVIQEDRDFRTILANPEGRFQVIVAPTNPSGLGGDYLIGLVSPRQDWHSIGAVGEMTVWVHNGTPGPGSNA